MNHLAYLQDLLRHKWFILIEGRKLGLPWYQLIVHDLSKFLPDEWRAGVAFRRTRRADAATLQKHYRRNRHHPQHWLKNGYALPMPERFRLEMLADWRSGGRNRERPQRGTPLTVTRFLFTLKHVLGSSAPWVRLRQFPAPVKAELLRRRRQARACQAGLGEVRRSALD